MSTTPTPGTAVLKCTVTISLNQMLVTKASALINLHHTGREQCNVYNGEELVLHPDITPETEAKLINAHSNMRRSKEITLLLLLDLETGETTLTQAQSTNTSAGEPT
jgi:hypothetical protein